MAQVNMDNQVTNLATYRYHRELNNHKISSISIEQAPAERTGFGQAIALCFKQWIADLFADASKMVENQAEEQLTREERREIEKINRQMEAVGLVLIPLAFILGAVCLVAQIGIYKGWW